MPIYEYRCENGHTFEVMQRMADDPLDVCQTCDAPAQRVLSAPAIHFKGSGFYNTDYGTKRRARETLAAAEGGSTKDGDSGSKKDSGSSSSSSDSGSKSSDSTSSKPAKAASSGD